MFPAHNGTKQKHHTKNKLRISFQTIDDICVDTISKSGPIKYNFLTQWLTISIQFQSNFERKKFPYNYYSICCCYFIINDLKTEKKTRTNSINLFELKRTLHTQIDKVEVRIKKKIKCFLVSGLMLLLLVFELGLNKITYDIVVYIIFSRGASKS